MTTTLINQQTMPGSHGEHDLQERYGTRSRAEAFYKHQVLNYLNPQMRTFIARQEMFFLSTADGHGECDVSFRAGEAGFVHVLNEEVLVFPEYHGNGVLASKTPKTLADYAAVLKIADSGWFCFFYAITFGGFVGLVSFLAIFFRDQYALTKVQAGVFATLCALTGSMIRPLGGALADRFRRHPGADLVLSGRRRQRWWAYRPYPRWSPAPCCS